MAEQSNQPNDGYVPMSSFAVLAAHMFWFAGGPIALAFLALKLATTKDDWTAPSDIAFLIVLVMTPVARWYSFGAGARTNTLGEVITLTELRRYTVSLMAGGALVWVVANVFGNLARQ